MHNESGRVFSALLPKMEKDIEEHTLLTKMNKKYLKDKVQLTKTTHDLFKGIGVRQPKKSENKLTEESSINNQGNQLKIPPTTINNTTTRAGTPKESSMKGYSNSMILRYIIKDRSKHSPLQYQARKPYNYTSALLSPSHSVNSILCSSDTNPPKTIVPRNRNSITQLKSSRYDSPIQFHPDKQVVLKRFLSSKKNKSREKVKETLDSADPDSPVKYQRNKTPRFSLQDSSIKGRLLINRRTSISHFRHNHYYLSGTIFQSFSGSTMALVESKHDELTQMIKDNNKDTKKEEQRKHTMKKLLTNEQTKSRILLEKEFTSEYKEHLNSGDNYKRQIKHNEMKQQLDLITKLTPDVVYRQRDLLEKRLHLGIDKEYFQVQKRSKSTIRRNINDHHKDNGALSRSPRNCSIKELRRQ